MRSSCGHIRAYHNRSSIASGYWAHLLFVKALWHKGAASVTVPGSHVMIKVLLPARRASASLGRWKAALKRTIVIVILVL